MKSNTSFAHKITNSVRIERKKRIIITNKTQPDTQQFHANHIQYVT